MSEATEELQGAFLATDRPMGRRCACWSDFRASSRTAERGGGRRGPLRSRALRGARVGRDGWGQGGVVGGGRGGSRRALLRRTSPLRPCCFPARPSTPPVNRVMCSGRAARATNNWCSRVGCKSGALDPSAERRSETTRTVNRRDQPRTRSKRGFASSPLHA